MYFISYNNSFQPQLKLQREFSIGGNEIEIGSVEQYEKFSPTLDFFLNPDKKVLSISKVNLKNYTKRNLLAA